jgi:hypothetical protein
MINSTGKLEVFERFRKDLDLPKFKPPEGELTDNPYAIYMSKVRLDNGGSITFNSDDGRPVLTLNRVGTIEITPSWWSRFRSLFRRTKPPIVTPPPEPIPTMSIPDFFTTVKKSIDNLEAVTHRAEGYEKALVNAKACGQKALVEELTRNLLAVRAEAHLVSMGLTRFITEEKLVTFVKECPKGLRLDWIANFTRVIPSALQEQKALCDDRFIFDNYLVLHYDPNGKSWAQTEEEKRAEEAARRDPILFGVLEGRRQLYYLGDWVDELCNLTLDQVADLLGADGISELA